MSDKRNALIDVVRAAAAAGIILSHADLSSYGAVGAFFSQFLSVRFSLMFFLAVIGFYLEKSYLQGKTPALKRAGSLTRVYALWSLVYLALSFLMLVVVQKMSLDEYFLSRIKGFFFSGSYYHFWFYPAAIYAILFIGALKKFLGNHSMYVLLPISVLLYVFGLFGTGYLPIGREIPKLSAVYALNDFEAFMHLALLGFPSVIFGMAAAHMKRKTSGRVVLLAALAYVIEAVVLCFVLSWREDPQMLITTPILTILFLNWARDSKFTVSRLSPAFFRTVSAGMYNVHPLIFAAFSLVLPGLDGLAAFCACLVISVLFGCVHYRLRNIRFFSWFL